MFGIFGGIFDGLFGVSLASVYSGASPNVSEAQMQQQYAQMRNLTAQEQAEYSRRLLEQIRGVDWKNASNFDSNVIDLPADAVREIK